VSDRRQQWLERSQAFGDEIRRYHESIGNDPNLPAVASTIKTNTELVPRRGDELLNMLDRLAALKTLQGLRVLDLGCGFGALISYVAWMGEPADVLATDVREDHVESARRCVEAIGFADRLRFDVADMGDLSRVAGEKEFDLVICHNAFIYLRRRGEMERAIDGFRRVLKPGGHVFFYQPNSRRLREPFTKAPLMHLLPRAVADVVAKRTRLKHSHDRVRYISPRKLGRMLERAGFDEVHAAPPGGREFGRLQISDYYGLAARRRG
jgi:2-polyprenyl-3-methyl-5-hydroxy-6-metoxy-1,4-benzoquinol methylase